MPSNWRRVYCCRFTTVCPLFDFLMPRMEHRVTLWREAREHYFEAVWYSPCCLCSWQLWKDVNKFAVVFFALIHHNTHKSTPCLHFGVQSPTWGLSNAGLFAYSFNHNINRVALPSSGAIWLYVWWLHVNEVVSVIMKWRYWYMNFDYAHDRGEDLIKRNSHLQHL